uniref:Uncharacterized protein n=1 Tax=Chromera velia CCMP2878 TaxID=1169474 RepID=A0A0G4H3T5_9ALVE|eukprot:Cvel_24529.t1-p1 / transcript=Cvel_24529.t1 / gene=Cvel_24529 / organism=Chromera_velia_CCMP2878 / gene_product=hypothetical protein / transcript_product=hypothetical protein / location=Cvel_scaffold2662:11940-14626(-) / protein_length=180 / sequence_SO=supercontig / SO=protein_coding / is_pseudo=false
MGSILPCDAGEQRYNALEVTVNNLSQQVEKNRSCHQDALKALHHANTLANLDYRGAPGNYKIDKRTAVNPFGFPTPTGMAKTPPSFNVAFRTLVIAMTNPYGQPPPPIVIFGTIFCIAGTVKTLKAAGYHELTAFSGGLGHDKWEIQSDKSDKNELKTPSFDKLLRLFQAHDPLDEFRAN